MKLNFLYFFILLLIININYINNTFTLDFSFSLPNSNNNTLITNNKIENNPINESFSKNLSYYFSISPMVKLCIGDPLQCFLIQISFSSYETILNLNSLNFQYMDSSSFRALTTINNTFLGSDTIKLGNEKKNLIDNYNFILTNESYINIISEIGLGKIMQYHYEFPAEYDFSLIKQLNNKEMIESSEITIKYSDDFSGELILGTNYTGMNIDESQYLELPNTENSLNGYLQSIYIEDATISTTKKQQKDLLAQEKRKRIKLDFNSTFIKMPEEIFNQIKLISFISYINAEICEVKKNEKLEIEYLICKDDILNSNLDRLFIIFNWKKNISVSLNDLFLPYNSENEKKNNIFGIISSKDNNTIYIGTVLLKKYMICLNREKNLIRLYLKNIQLDAANTDIFGIVGIITLTIIICMLMIYMVSTICGKDKYEPTYSPHVQKFLSKKTLDSSFKSNDTF